MKKRNKRAVLPFSGFESKNEKLLNQIQIKDDFFFFWKFIFKFFSLRIYIKSKTGGPSDPEVIVNIADQNKSQVFRTVITLCSTDVIPG